MRVTPPMNSTFSDDSLFLKKNLGGGHKFSEFACYAPNFEKVDGAYCFWSVGACVRGSHFLYLL